MNRSSHPQSVHGEITSLPSGDVRFLRANSDAYERVLRDLQSNADFADPERVLRSVQNAARSATRFHAGRFADGTIENLVLNIGAQLAPAASDIPTPPHRSSVTKRRVLHIVSTAISIGGLTRMLWHWISSDLSSTHSIVLLDQKKIPVPSWLSGSVNISGGTVTTLASSLSLSERAIELRRLATTEADLAVLHHGGWDVVPTLAFATAGGPPVAVLNHADHEFWLGSSVADLVINLRTAAVAHTRERRFIERNVVLPIPLARPDTTVSKDEAKRSLGISPETIVVVSIARGEKFRPHGSYDFMATAVRLLQRNPEVQLLIVGESKNGISEHLRRNWPDRLKFFGSVEDPAPYRSAADLFLEPFPFGSQTSVLEAALGGVPIVPAYAPLFSLLVANDDSLLGLLPQLHTESEYIGYAERLIRDPAEREAISRELRRRMQADHLGPGWLASLARIYAQTDRLVHDPHPIPESPFTPNADDIGLSQWRRMPDGRTTDLNPEVDSSAAILAHSAYLARETRQYFPALLFAVRFWLREPFKCASWRLIAVNSAGRLAEWLRQMEVRLSNWSQSRASTG